ncbi:MAG: hypothetical protein AAGA56_05535, partial [Myxococcota bacterium]
SKNLVAVDFDTGSVLPRGPLPLASAWGELAFSDGWRAVVDTDVRGPMATFDAGRTWIPFRVDENVVNAFSVGSDPVLFTESGRAIRVDEAGHVHAKRSHNGSAASTAREASGLGLAALETAIAHGYPIAKGKQALVAHEGTLYRIALPSGRVLAERAEAIADETARCRPVELGKGLGFVCGRRDGATTIWSYREPLRAEELVRFEEPRRVVASGDGTLIVQGTCEAADRPKLAESDEQSLAYCIVRGTDQAPQQIAVRGEVGAERVAAFADGRAAVLVPPRADRPGRVTVIRGSKLEAHELRYPEDKPKAAALARRGMWLEGLRVEGETTLVGWVEAGGPVIGVRVDTATGAVTLGQPMQKGKQALFDGPRALVLTGAGNAFESLDGGSTWRELTLPSIAPNKGRPAAVGCSPLGCLLPGWTRLGWGESRREDDLETVAGIEKVSTAPAAPFEGLPALVCTTESIRRAKLRPERVDRDRTPQSRWEPFLDTAPPSLAPGERGLDTGTRSSRGPHVRVYAWGPKGADWSKTGSWEMRFEDPFRFEGVHRSAITRPPYPGLDAAANQLGLRGLRSSWSWEARLDPAGDRGLLHRCMGSSCFGYAVAADAAPVPLAGTGGKAAFALPPEHGVVSVGETLYALTTSQINRRRLALYRARGTRIEELAQIRRLKRIGSVTYANRPALVRQVFGGEFGMSLETEPDPGSNEPAHIMVLPFDPLRREFGEPIDLGAGTFRGSLPPMCKGDEGGWLIRHPLPAFGMGKATWDLGPGSRVALRQVQVVARMTPTAACIEAVSATPITKVDVGRVRPTRSAGIPMMVRASYGANRYALRCRVK